MSNVFLRNFGRIAGNGLALGAVADLEALNCQPSQILNRSAELYLTTSPAIEPNAG